jgi:hypothetical protein
MKRNLLFFALVAAAVSFLHLVLVTGLTHLALSGSPGLAAFIAPVLWLLTAPMNFLLTSSFGRSLAPAPSQVLLAANSLIWGFLLTGLMLWRKLRAL